MNKPASPATVNLNVPAHVKNKKLIQWVEEIASLTQPIRFIGAMVPSLNTTHCANC